MKYIYKDKRYIFLDLLFSTVKANTLVNTGKY